MSDLRTVLTVWPFALVVELSIVAFFLWVGRDKPQKPSREDHEVIRTNKEQNNDQTNI